MPEKEREKMTFWNIITIADYHKIRNLIIIFIIKLQIKRLIIKVGKKKNLGCKKINYSFISVNLSEKKGILNILQ